MFPGSFRSGWHFMDNDWQAHLNQLIPYSMDDDFGAYRAWYTNSGPVAGVDDWSRAPSVFVPFHPSTNDYQVPGAGKGWNVRSIKMQRMVQANMDYIFEQASDGADQVACIWSHLPENFAANVERIGSFISVAASNNPAVPFRYCTAVEAMQRWRGATNWLLPQIDVQQDTQGQQVTLTVSANTEIFQDQPFVALRDSSHQYTNLTASCRPAGSNTWSLALPIPLNRLAKVGIAVTDLAGNVATRIIPYLADDLHIDDLDPQCTEVRGDWASTTNAAWGTDSRIAPLGSTNVAQVQWLLPISRSGAYSISIQVPPLENSASNITYRVLAGGSVISSAFCPAPLPANEWVYLFSPILDTSASNVLEMIVDGAGQPGACAVADVVRVAPLGYDHPVISIAPGPSDILLLVAGQPGQTCHIQRSSSLISGWTTLDTLIVPPEGILRYRDGHPPQSGAYYRVQED